MTLAITDHSNEVNWVEIKTLAIEFFNKICKSIQPQNY